MASTSSVSCSYDSVVPTPGLEVPSCPPGGGEQLQPFVVVVICLGACLVLLLVVIAVTAIFLKCFGGAPSPGDHRVQDLETAFQNPSLEQDMKRKSPGTLLLPPNSRLGKIVQRLQGSIHQDRERSSKEISRVDLSALSPKQRLRALEFSHSAVCLMGEITETNLGKVYNGEALGLGHRSGSGEDSPSTTVLVKSLREEADSSVQKLFDVEMVWAAGFRHPNILGLLAVSTMEEPRYMLYEYLEFGSLKTFLLSTAAVWIDFESIAETDTSSTTQRLVGIDELLNIGMQVAAGMEYLAGKWFVHKDLAARNCHVGTGLQVKIANFGLSYELHSEDYCSIHSKNSYPLPLRWLAPESLKHGQFSTFSDRWGFGVLLWEVFSLGARPYGGLSNAQAAQHIQVCRLLQRPKHCPTDVYNIMLQCWHKDPQQRSTFSAVKEGLKVFISLYHEETMLSHRVSLASLRIPSTPEVSRTKP